MVSQDLAKGYERKNSVASCLIKLDLQKVYDTVEWDFVEEMLVGLQFPNHSIHLFIQCVRSPRFSLSINGSLHGFFEGKRGLRQGDPLSPLLFVSCIKYLSRILVLVGEKEGFKFHPRCVASKLNHLCFPDDIILCCKGDFRSVN